jgi:hypothetical protein
MWFVPNTWLTSNRKEKMINHIDSNFEVFKEYNDNPEFKAFLAGQMFKLLIYDIGNFKIFFPPLQKK